ncbi:MAG: glutamate-5-semialdehyde dehydrogenase [Treponema sp.]|nr:glutamate-5-semialdehyde dehydrogenase [Treponema sp.]
MNDIVSLCKSLRQGASVLASFSADEKNRGLKAVASALDAHRQEILAANELDVQRALSEGMKESLVDRLRLTSERIDGIIDSINIVIQQTDPVGQVVAGWTTPNGLQIRQQRVPLGVAAIIYESRPNVTVDAFALAYKSGNSILLRGSSSALNSNKALVSIIKTALNQLEGTGPVGVASAIELACSGSRSEVDDILNATGLIDVVLPRGGAQLIRMVVEKARVPVIETGSGVCHLFVDKSADFAMACSIAENGKLQRPGVCNALETFVIHQDILEEFLPLLEEKLAGCCELRCDEASFPVLKAAAQKAGRAHCVVEATEEDFGYEFLDTIAAVKTVASVDEAIAYINSHNTMHSESIITESLANATKFQQQVDAACVYVNASTRFTDGGEFGFGAELGISTQKLHARGPMGLEALTTTKYFIEGKGQVR